MQRALFEKNKCSDEESELKKPLYRDYNFREIFFLEVKLGLDPKTLGSNSTLHCFSINEVLAGDWEIPLLRTLPC